MEGESISASIRRSNPHNYSCPSIFIQVIGPEKSAFLKKMNDWKAVEEMTCILRNFDPEDPVKYDFALFIPGVNEYF
jgi:hypothetical protein